MATALTIPHESDPRYQLVIFDFDGTLADSGNWFLSIAGDLADRFNFRHVDDEEIERLRGMPSRDVIRYLGIPRWKLPKMSRYIHALLAQQIDRIEMFDGIASLIETLSDAGIRLAVVTSNAENNARAVLGPSLSKRFEWFECGASLYGKAPRFRRIIKRSQIPADRVLAIGDETRDIIAARKAGIDVAAVLWGYANRDVLTGLAPDAVLEAPSDVMRTVLGRP